MLTRPVHNHAYGHPPAQPRRVINGMALRMSLGEVSGDVPVVAPVSAPGGPAWWTADGATYWTGGPGPRMAARPLPGGHIPLDLPPRAAQVDLSDMKTWDRPVIFDGAR